MKRDNRFVRQTRLRTGGSLVDIARTGQRESLEPPAHAKPARKPRSLVLVPAEREVLTPDLLHATPAQGLDEASLQHTLAFAFVAGSAGGAVTSALAHAALAPSSFSAEALQDDLFLTELCAICFDFSVHGKPAPIDRTQLRRLLAQPPRDHEHTQFRQAILAELVEHPELVRALEHAYERIAALPVLLDGDGVDARLDVTQWRLDVLTAVRDAVIGISAGFGSARSGLSRLHAFAEHVARSEGYQKLQALLEFEGDAARAQLQIRLGADGRIRQLEILSLRERSDSPLHVSFIERTWRRLLAWLQGYRIGPNEVVDRWLESVFDGVRPFIPALLQLKGDIEFYLGALHFRQLAADKGLATCLPSFVDAADGGGKVVRKLFNPLLLAERTPPVPTDLVLPSFTSTCITTGPNSGGKTRFLQALSLLQLMGQAGAFVPAAQATLKRASGMFVSLGEQAHADQKEGRLGMELLRIRKLFEHAQPGSIVILDELCSGTNPSEGEEIFRMLLELLHELQHEVYVTTHFLTFAQSLVPESEVLGLCFLQVELDAQQHATYQFVPGVATTSLAHQTAQRLGVTREQLHGLIRKRS